MRNVAATQDELAYWKQRMEDYHNGHQQEVCNEVFLSLEKYIHHIANKFSGLEHDDLFAIGTLALVENLDKYDPETQKILPITYMKRHIFGAMYEAVSKEKGLSKNDSSVKKMIDDAVIALREQGIAPTIKNIAKYINQPRISEEVIYNNLRITRSASNIVHLDKEIDEKSKVLDTLALPYSNPEDIYLEKEKTELLEKALESLSVLESSVIRMCELEKKSLTETARLLNTTPTEIRKARTNAIIRLYNDKNLNYYMKKDNETNDNIDYCHSNINISFRDSEDDGITFVLL